MGKKVTVGYWYGATMHMALAHGPADALTEVIVGDRSAWAGSLTANGTIAISRRDLFGGEEREGGLDGTLEVMFGAASQAPNAYLQSKFGASDTPAFRGVTTVLWRGLLSAMNPYIKPWRFRLRRIPSAWYPAKAAIGSSDANPAHIVREALTDQDWGLAYSAADIDDAAFTAAADTLHAEGFGLSILWDRESSIDDFLAAVMRHIDGALFVHPRTGQFVLRLVRDDYSLPGLPVLSPANVIEVVDFSRPTAGELVNQIVLTYRDGPTDKDAAITVQDIALVAAQGSVVSESIAMLGISQSTLAARVAERELRQRGSALARVTLVADRSVSHLMPGDPFKFTWPAWGITELVMRVARIAYGDTADGRVRIDAVQDVFALPQASYAATPSSGWTDPISAPAPCPAQLAYEVPYWQIVQDVVGEIPSILADIDPTDGMVASLGARPSADAINYHAWAWDAAKSAWADRGRGAFAPTALLVAAMPQGAASVTVTLTSAIDLHRVAVDDLAIVDDEWLLVTAVNVPASQVTLARGVLDTVPAAHAAGARVWFAQPHYIQPEYVAGETAQLRLTPITGRGELAVGSATTFTRSIQQRFVCPYPPGNVRFNGAAYPAAAAGDLAISWARRNRVTQTGAPVLQTAGDITPETGQTTTIRIYGGASQTTLRRTFSALSGTSQTWTLADAAADGAASEDRIRVELEASRTDGHGTFVSLYKHSVTVDRAGYGLRYGQYWGGA
jgi:hypothetical protein